MKLEAGDALDSPPRTTMLGTVFSPVFNYFSPANRAGEVFTRSPYLLRHDQWGTFYMMVFVLLTLQRYLTHPELFCFTPDLSNSHLLGLDLPGQAMEAEEIIKQLDMEQVEEMPMGTATSSPGQCAPPHPTAMSPYHSHAERGEEDEEEDVVTRVDLPPVTGTQLKLLQEQWAFLCLSVSLSV